MKLLSLFDGEGGFPLAAVMNGIEPVAASEIEPYPIAITRSRFPKMKHLGDIALVNGADIEPVDIATFGSPCQSMSLAGKREGLKHESQGDEETTRSGMFFEAIRIMTEMREVTNGQYPRFAVWENVPGAFSSGGGRDFLAVLQAIAAIAEPSVSIPEPERDSKTDNLIWFSAGSIVGNGWSIAWRTLDAQYWGVPQRRKRIYLIADFGSERAADILLERYSLRGNIAEGGETRERVTEDAIGCADGSIGSVAGINQPHGIGRTFGIVTKGNGEAFLSEEKHATLTSGGGQAGQGYPAILSMTDTLNESLGIKCLNPWDSQTSRVYDSVGVHPAISANSGGGQDRHGVVYSFDSMSSNSMKSSNPNSGCREVDVAKCIDTTFPDPSKNQGGVCVVQSTLVFNETQITSPKNGNNPKWNDPCHTLAATDRPPTVVAFAQNQRDEVRDLNGVAGALAAEPGSKQQTYVCALQQNASGEVRASDVAYTLNTNGNATGRNSPLICEAQPVIALQANGIDRADTAGCNGAGWREDQSYTLNTVDRHAVVFENHQQDSRITECDDIAPTVSRKFGTGGNNTPLVCEPYQDKIGSLCSTDYKWVQQQQVEQGKLIVTNRDKDKRYIVRRLMPIETTRLQGYPDFWHHLAPFDGDVEFWESVRKTWARINGTTYKPFKDIARLEKWYYKLRNDGAEYKADGNSLAIPCAEYVIRRIAETVREEEKLSAEETI